MELSMANLLSSKPMTKSINFPNGEKVLDSNEAAQIANRDESTIRRWCANGKLPATRSEEGDWVIRKTDLTSYLEKKSISGYAPVSSSKVASIRSGLQQSDKNNRSVETRLADQQGAENDPTVEQYREKIEKLVKEKQHKVDRVEELEEEKRLQAEHAEKLENQNQIASDQAKRLEEEKRREAELAAKLKNDLRVKKIEAEKIAAQHQAEILESRNQQKQQIEKLEQEAKSKAARQLREYESKFLVQNNFVEKAKKMAQQAEKSIDKHREALRAADSYADNAEEYEKALMDRGFFDRLFNRKVEKKFKRENFGNLLTDQRPKAEEDTSNHVSDSKNNDENKVEPQEAVQSERNISNAVH